MRRAVTPVCVTLSLSLRTHVIRHLSLPAECARVGGSLQVMTTCPSKQVRSGDGQLSRLLGGGDMGGHACRGAAGEWEMSVQFLCPENCLQSEVRSQAACG